MWRQSTKVVPRKLHCWCHSRTYISLFWVILNFLKFFLKTLKLPSRMTLAENVSVFFPMFVYGVKTVHEEKNKKDCISDTIWDCTFETTHIVNDINSFIFLYLGALINLLQTVVHLEPKCCNPSHFSLFLGAYGAKRFLCGKLNNTM